MALLRLDTIVQVPASHERLVAFKISCDVDRPAFRALTIFVNQLGESLGDLNLLLDMTDLGSREWATLGGDNVCCSRLRKMRRIQRFVIVASPDIASEITFVLDRITPKNAKAYDACDLQSAWKFACG